MDAGTAALIALEDKLQWQVDSIYRKADEQEEETEEEENGIWNDFQR